MRWIITGLSGLLTYIFGFVIDPMQFPSEHWMIFAFVVVGVTMAAAHIGPVRIVRWLWSTMTASTSSAPVARSLSLSKGQTPTIPTQRNSMDLAKYLEMEARRKEREVRLEELRKTEEAKRQAIAESIRLKAEAQAVRLAAKAPVGNVPTVAVPPKPTITVLDAVYQSMAGKGIAYIGQQQTGLCEIAEWNANATNMLAVFGGNGTGKTTSVGTMAALSMVAWGWWLTILDGKDAGDWDEFSPYAIVSPLKAGNAVELIRAQYQEFERRKQIMSDRRCANWHKLPAPIKQIMPQWGTLIEEYGATRKRLSATPTALKQFDTYIDILSQEARYTGWHGVFIDQRPQDYSAIVLGNLNTVACFRLGNLQGNAVNAYQAHLLAKPGEFEMEEQRYFAFHVEPIVRQLLMTLPRKNWEFPRTQVTNATNDERSLTNADRSQNGYERSHERPLPEANATNANDLGGGLGALTLPPSIVRSWVRNRSWDEVGQRFFAVYPDAAQVDLRTAMAHLAGDGRKTSAFNGEAFRVYHLYSKNGKNYKGGN